MRERMIVAFTGHRSPAIGGYDIPNDTYLFVCRQTAALLKELKPEKCITGMAIGYDQYAAYVCIKLGIPYIAAIPFIGQEKRWVAKSKRVYQALLNKAVETVVVCPEFSIAAYQKRNEWMVDNCDQLIACWNETAGGTANCVAYAKKVGKPIHFLQLPEVAH